MTDPMQDLLDMPMDVIPDPSLQKNKTRDLLDPNNYFDVTAQGKSLIVTSSKEKANDVFETAIHHGTLDVELIRVFNGIRIQLRTNAAHLQR